MRILALFLIVHLMLQAYDVTNGQVVLFEFDKAQSLSLRKEAQTIPFLSHPSKPSLLIALVAIPYKHHDPITLHYITTLDEQKIALHVKQGDYPKEQLSVEPSKVKPPQKALAQIKQEAQEAAKIYNTFTPTRFWTTPFTLPMHSEMTSMYGTARMFNDTLQSYHSGTDFRAAIGTAIYAANDGVVVLAKERYYAGGSVIIDHGEGIYSVYYHLSHIGLHVGDMIKKSELIGLSGASGRVTGPHLHFGFVIQGVPIDPLDFIAKIDALF